MRDRTSVKDSLADSELLLDFLQLPRHEVEIGYLPCRLTLVC